MSKIKNLFQDQSPEERAKILDDYCHHKEKDMVRRNYTDEDLAEMKNILSERSIELSDLEAEIKDLMQPFKDKSKGLKKFIAELLVDLKKKYTESYEMVYFVDDQEAGLMRAYDVHGNFLYERKLKPGEKQKTIPFINEKTA